MIAATNAHYTEIFHTCIHRQMFNQLLLIFWDIYNFENIDFLRYKIFIIKANQPLLIFLDIKF